MLKFFFWILLLGNAGLLIYQQGFFDDVLPSNREPARLANQLNADKITILPGPPSGSAGASASVETATAPEAAPAQEVTETAAASVAAPEPPALVCAEVGNFNPDEARRFTTEVASLGARLSQRPVQEVSGHIVYIPPQTDKEAAERKAGELRRLGITDFFVIQDNSPLRHAISLGVFKHEEAARAHLAALNRKGVRTARIGQRMSNGNLVAIQLAGLTPDARAALQKIKTGFPRQEIRSCQAN